VFDEPSPFESYFKSISPFLSYKLVSQSTDNVAGDDRSNTEQSVKAGARLSWELGSDTSLRWDTALSYFKFKTNLGAYFEKNTTRYIIQGDSDVAIVLTRDEDACSFTFELYSESILTVPYDLNFDVSFRYSENESEAFSRQVACAPAELGVNLHACQITNIPIQCDTSYDYSLSNQEGYYDDVFDKSVDVPQSLGWRLVSVKLHTLEDWETISNTGNQTLAGQSASMEAFAVGNFAWIIFELALILIVLFLLTSVSRIISGGGGNI